MTDNEIIKALECCIDDDEGIKERPCQDCPLLRDDVCSNSLRKHSLDLINRQKAEIERLQKLNDEIIDKLKCMTEENHKLACDKYENEIRAIKEFAERLKEKAFQQFDFNEYVEVEEIDNLLKEMVGDDNA